MFHKTYSTGGLFLELTAEEPILDTAFFKPFLVHTVENPDVAVCIRRDRLPAVTGTEHLRTNHRCAVRCGNIDYLYTTFSDSARMFVPYACRMRRNGETSLIVNYNDRLWDSMLFEGLFIPDLLLEHNTAVIHAAFVGMSQEGILFAGPKQQGKTTQATLWQTHLHATLINGDRAAVREDTDGFYAYGVPFCGSSRVCLNEKRKLRAVVFPEKADANEVVELSSFACFKRLIGCLSYTETDRAAQNNALDAAERIAGRVPGFLLRCRPDEEAVKTLARALCLSVEKK